MKRLVPALILLLLLIGSVFFAQWRLQQTTIPELYEVPDFEFKSHLGNTYTNENFNDKITVANFIFTNCPGICPVMSRKMAVIYEKYETQKDVQFVSFSVDPERDSLQALIEYAENWGVADQRWQFLKTEKEAIETLYENGFKLGGELPRGHSGAFVLIDENGVIRGYYNYEEEESLTLLNEHIDHLKNNL
ncbi:MAG: SCO family protein [Calditrichaeota bacterium]|nr:MAG: SCO family protein [Calditrichota bacterium]MBL1206631.1 SCO family protein [Calditrichota bacterium]NOG46458.1 SCO family protein [Calditrichota bacterium]